MCRIVAVFVTSFGRRRKLQSEKRTKRPLGRQIRESMNLGHSPVKL
jgi:hypothetical protein